MSTTLIRLDAQNDPMVGGFAITFPSGTCKALTWQSAGPIVDTMAAAKQYAARALQTCLDENRRDDAERTNWASVTAAVQRIVLDFNEVRRQQLRAVDNPSSVLTKH